ncbi:MAG: hypothetical protein ACYS74_12125, partial [Planctomycetota bacterium]
VGILTDGAFRMNTRFFRCTYVCIDVLSVQGDKEIPSRHAGKGSDPQRRRKANVPVAGGR